MNKKILIYSAIGLLSIVLMFLIDWLFIIPAALVVYLNQKELMKDKKH